MCRTATARERQPGGARHGLTTDDEREAGLERLARSLEDVGLPERNSPMRTVTTLLALVAVFGAASPVLDAQAHIRRDGAFTDSTGRTVLYRYWTRSDWNMSEPRGVLMYFHGNSRGTADDLRRIEWPALLQALDLGLPIPRLVRLLLGRALQCSTTQLRSVDAGLSVDPIRRVPCQ